MAIHTQVVTVFGSSRPARGEAEYRAAYDVGRCISEAGFVVCNGGYGGTMEASARGAKESAATIVPADRRTIGVLADAFGGRPANSWIDVTIRVDSHVDRLLKLIALGDAYVVLKGGTGTLLEFAAVWEFMNKRMMSARPIVVVGDFWDGVVRTLREELMWEGLGECTSYVTAVSTPEECVRILREKFQHV